MASNIIKIRERVLGCGVPNTLLGVDALDRVFAYNPTYRLISATGRECNLPQATPWDASPRCSDLSMTRTYTQAFRYDGAGNLEQLQHQAHGGSFTRKHQLEANTNRLSTATVGQSVYEYRYDANGNISAESQSRTFQWSYADRMLAYRTQTQGAEPSVYAHYLYDSAGQRVRKLVRNQSGAVRATVYMGREFEHHRLGSGNTAVENSSLHVMGGPYRIATVRVGGALPGVKVLDVKLPFARTGRIWPYCGDKDHPVIVYDYTATRERAGPEKFLEGYRGYLQVDAYGGYDAFFKDPARGLIEVGCWAHYLKNDVIQCGFVQRFGAGSGMIEGSG